MGVFWILFVGWMIYGAIRIGPRPANYVHPGKLPIVAFWNVLDETRFTDEAIEYHKRTLGFTAQTLVIAVSGLILQAIFSG